MLLRVITFVTTVNLHECVYLDLLLWLLTLYDKHNLNLNFSDKLELSN